jgi:hypothetical protein
MSDPEPGVEPGVEPGAEPGAEPPPAFCVYHAGGA